jgi:hypothetical protein
MFVTANEYMDELITMAEGAQLARLSVDAFRSMLRRHGIPTTDRGGRQRFVRRGNILDFLKSRSIR